ncbi:hypothetical protein EON64_21020, partial [archaeon]
MSRACFRSGDGEAASAAALSHPHGIFLETLSNILYIAEFSSHVIRSVNLSSGIIRVVVGAPRLDDAAASAFPYFPLDVWANSAGDVFAVYNGSSCVVRRTSAGEMQQILVGSGPCSYTEEAGSFTGPDRLSGIVGDTAGNMYVSTIGHGMVGRVHWISANGIMSTIAGGGSVTFGSGVAATSIALGGCYGLRVDQVGHLVLSDALSGRLWKINTPPASAAVAVIASSLPTLVSEVNLYYTVPVINVSQTRKQRKLDTASPEVTIRLSSQLYVNQQRGHVANRQVRAQDSHRFSEQDIATWTTRTSPADNGWRSVCWSAELGLFVAVAHSGTGNRVMTS